MYWPSAVHTARNPIGFQRSINVDRSKGMAIKNMEIITTELLKDMTNILSQIM